MIATTHRPTLVHDAGARPISIRPRSSADGDLARLLDELGTEAPAVRGVLDLVLRTVSDGVALATRSSVWFNPSARRTLGLVDATLPGPGRFGAELTFLHDFSPVSDDDHPLARALDGEETVEAQLFARSSGMADAALISLGAKPLRDGAGRVLAALAVFHDLGAQKRAQEELSATNRKLAAWVAELERRADVTLLMNEMTDLLQSCRTMREFYSVVTRFGARIFPQEAGCMYLVNSSRSALEMVASWGGMEQPRRALTPDACWALRRGRLHRAGDGALGLDCEHTSSDGTPGYACIPMMGQGEALGVLHVMRHPDDTFDDAELGAAVSESRLRTIVSMSEHVGLALANLKLREKLQMQAIRDPLTGLFNRRYMEVSLERELARAARSGGSVSVVMVDIDHFKQFNDTFGHAAADHALRETAALLASSMRTEDVACRFGGEELVLIFPETTPDEAVGRAESIRAALCELQLRFQGAALGAVTASFGVATYSGQGAGEDLLRAADEALYRAKREGRNRVCAASAHVDPASSSGANGRKST